MENYINTNPGPEVKEENRSWQGCPTVARTAKGRLFAGWYTGGMFEPCIDNYNLLVFSDDNGVTWSNPILSVGSNREMMVRNIDIQLWVDPYNALWVMYTHSPYSANSKKATIRTDFECDYHEEFTGVELLCMVRNISNTERTGMKVMLSDDDGQTWENELILDERPFVSYPDLAEGDGFLYIVHDRERDNRIRLDKTNWTSDAAKEILISRITEEDIRNGSIGPDSFTAHILSKGLKNQVER